MISRCDPVALRALAEALERARAERTALVPPPILAEMEIADAYTVQDALIALREAAGLRPCGWKLGNTSAVKQRVMGLLHPVFGRIFAQGAFDDGATVPMRALINPRFEPELAFGLRAPLPANGTRAEILAAIDWVAPALEVTDSRYTPGRRTANELISDCTSAAGFVIGPRTPFDGARAFDDLATALLRNGEPLATGSTRDVLGDPLVALELLAAHVAERGASTQAGDIVLSGAITDAFSAAPGDRVEARVAGLGSVRVAFG
jgi:2-oxo-3-hexenedioate decarboxylase